MHISFGHACSERGRQMAAGPNAGAYSAGSRQPLGVAGRIGISDGRETGTGRSRDPKAPDRRAVCQLVAHRIPGLFAGMSIKSILIKEEPEHVKTIMVSLHGILPDADTAAGRRAGGGN